MNCVWIFLISFAISVEDLKKDKKKIRRNEITYFIRKNLPTKVKCLPFIFLISFSTLSHVSTILRLFPIGIPMYLKGMWSRRNVVTIKAILRGFELASSLKINFHKSRIAGVNVNRNAMVCYAKTLNCDQMGVPFKYLGLEVGGNPRNTTF